MDLKEQILLFIKQQADQNKDGQLDYKDLVIIAQLLLSIFRNHIMDKEIK